ncbi:MAG: RAD55 family ATPase [Nanobdellota archaeon]
MRTHLSSTVRVIDWKEHVLSSEMGTHFWDKPGAKPGKAPNKKKGRKKNSGSSDSQTHGRMPTGIEGFDGLIQGGLRKGSTVLVEGGAGTGKTIFCTQFIVNGIENYDEKGVIVSFEEEKDSFYDEMKVFGWDLAKYEKENKFNYLRYNPEQVEKVLSGGGGIIRDVIDRIGAKRIVIDSISALTMLYDDILSRKEATLNLFKTIKKWGCTAIVIGQPEGTDSNIEHHPFNLLEYECDGVVRLYNVREDDSRKRKIEVYKMRGTDHSPELKPMRITDEGVEVDED